MLRHVQLPQAKQRTLLKQKGSLKFSMPVVSCCLMEILMYTWNIIKLITHHSIPLDSQGVLPPSLLRCAVCWCRGGSTSAAARPAAADAAHAAQQWMEVVEAAATAATSAAGASNGSGTTNWWTCDFGGLRKWIYQSALLHWWWLVSCVMGKIRLERLDCYKFQSCVAYCCLAFCRGRRYCSIKTVSNLYQGASLSRE